MNKKEIIKIIDKLYNNEEIISIVRIIILLIELKRRNRKKQTKGVKK